MSLINEALKRARLEAARQDAAKKGYVLASDQSLHRSGHSREIPRRKLLRAGLITSVVALIGLVGYALFYFGNERSRDEQLTGGLATPQTSSASLRLSPETPRMVSKSNVLNDTSVGLRDPGIDPGMEPALDPSQRQPESFAKSPQDSEVPTDEFTVASTAETENGSETSQDRGNNPSHQVTPIQMAPAQETFEREFTLGDGTRVELGGIAWSNTGPYALVNGRVMGVGEFVAGLAIESIHPTYILLKGGGRRVQLTVR